MTYLVTILSPDSANSGVMQGASCIQRKVSMVLFVLPSVLLLVVIVVTIVIVVVISVVVVVVIVGVVVVVVGSSVSSINKLSLMIVGSFSCYWSSTCPDVPISIVSIYHVSSLCFQSSNNAISNSQQAATRNRGKTIVNSPPSIYDPEPSMVAKDNEISQQAATRNRGKPIVNSPTPIYDQELSMVTEDDEMSKDKEIDKLMALISLSFKKIYKPTNNNLRTSSNTSRANHDNFPRINKGTGYENQRLGNVVRTRRTVGTTVVQKSGIQCYNCKEFGHIARECQKIKRAKDAAYHREKLLLYKQEEARIQLNVEQADWKDDTDDEFDDQELEAHYMYMAKLQEVTPDAADNSGPIFDTEPVQQVQHNDNYNVFSIKSEHPEQSESINDTYSIEQDEHNMIIDYLDMSYDRE
nr:hypothetical protein [Tanacetum cinerariifolium]